MTKWYEEKAMQQQLERQRAQVLGDRAAEFWERARSAIEAEANGIRRHLLPELEVGVISKNQISVKKVVSPGVFINVTFEESVPSVRVEWNLEEKAAASVETLTFVWTHADDLLLKYHDQLMNAEAVADFALRPLRQQILAEE